MGIMKYLKTIQALQSLKKSKYPIKYWKIISKKNIRISLKKTGMSQDEIEKWCNSFENTAKNTFYILSEYDDITQKYKWNWSNFKPKYWFINNNLEFMGTIKSSDFETDADKYNL
jgi:uncharacterized protein Usg